MSRSPRRAKSSRKIDVRILILHGPNLNMLGTRETEIYGTTTQDEIFASCKEKGQSLSFSAVECRQSNHEGELVDWIQGAVNGAYTGLIINAAAYTHTSIAIHDALKSLTIPIIEVHISDPETREDFRHHSYIAPLATAVIKGHGEKGYDMALEKLAEITKL